MQFGLLGGKTLLSILFELVIPVLVGACTTYVFHVVST